MSSSKTYLGLRLDAEIDARLLHRPATRGLSALVRRLRLAALTKCQKLNHINAIIMIIKLHRKTYRKTPAFEDGK